MTIDVIIPLVATIAYVPLLAVLLLGQRWYRRHRLFIVFLFSAFLWSLMTFLSMGEFLGVDRSIEVRIVLCIYIWMLVQFHFFIASFYREERMKIPWPYAFLVVTVALAIGGYVPAQVEPIVYGVPITVISLTFLATVGARDIASLTRRYRVSADPGERNQISYLLAAIAVLAVFLLLNMLPVGARYPISHAGNLIVAGVLTYAVVAHRLLDVMVVLRKALVNFVLYGTGIGLVLLVFWLSYRPEHRLSAVEALLLALTLGIPAVLFFVNRLGARWRSRMEHAFIGERYDHRRKLSQFVSTIHDVPDMEQFGKEFVGLLSESVDARRSGVLLPRGGDGVFVARFVYPPSAGNPMSELLLLPDSPVVTWLRKERTILPERNLGILPEFQSMWQEEKESVDTAEVEVFIPVVNRGEVAAILAIGGRRDGKLYTVEDVHLLESITAQVAASLEKEYYHEQMEEQRKEIDLLNRLATIVTSSMSIDSIFEGFVGELKHVVDLDWATIALVEDDELHILALCSNIDSPWKSDGRIPLAGTATEYVCRERKSVYEPDLAAHQRFVTGKHHFEQGVRSILYLPLQVKEECIGAFIVASRERDAFGPKQIRLLEQVAMQIATPVENSQLYAAAEQRSRVDELTGLFNRRHFEERIKEEISRHGRHGEDFSLLYLDLDNFKTYNDIYGHPTGDTLLSQIARIVKGSIRGADQAFRYGGDEFVVILPRTGMGDAQVVAERVRSQIFARMQDMEVAVTCSIGVSTYPSDGVIPGELVTVADTAQYFAKRTGGNRVYLSSKILSEPLEEVGVSSRHNGLSTIYALASIVEARDPYTYGHSRRVNTFAVALAERVGLSPDEVSRVSTAAMLHDIGKIGILDRVLNKKGKLSEEDWEMIKAHPKLGATIIGRIPNLVSCVSIILHHHERWDGGGYPEGLKGEEISIEARILAIADSFEAMTSARPYRSALCSEKAVKEMRRCAGSQFDPELVEVFLGVLEGGAVEQVKVGQTPPDE